MTKLVIVESPGKTPTVEKYLGPGYKVKASYGHIRDLPPNDEELPPTAANVPWAKEGVNVEGDFELFYMVPTKSEGGRKAKTQVVSELKAEASRASEVILATDDDREGEAIAYGLMQELGLPANTKRIRFGVITKEAITTALLVPGTVNMSLVHAQEARRALDRLYGYRVSPVLGRKVKRGMSAGRVQSAALAALARQEMAILNHVAGGYTRVSIEAQHGAGPTFSAALVQYGGQILATGKDFGSDGQLKPGSDLLILDEARGKQLAQLVKGAELQVTSSSQRPFATNPPAPFTTSSLQQEASIQLKLNPADCMEVAQQLYEGGVITYMRTDSVSLSKEATEAARAAAIALHGPDCIPEQPRSYQNKGKNVQAAHEAIRPAGSTFVAPDAAQIGDKALSKEQKALYDLIYRRTIASQMKELTGVMNVLYIVFAPEAENAVFAAQSREVLTPGYTVMYQVGKEESDDAEKLNVQVPLLSEGEGVKALSAEVEQGKSKSPRRFTEAALVKSLEAAGVGRPSTYAATVQTLADRGYTVKNAREQLVVTWDGLLAWRFLELNFPNMTNTRYTVDMEAQLDDIEAGKRSYLDFMRHFWATELQPAIEVAEHEGKVAFIDVPKVAGARVGVIRGEINLKYQDRYAPIPAGVLPIDLNLENVQRIVTGQPIVKKPERKKAAPKAAAEKKPRKKKE